jgi:hypothetical protein
MTKRIHNKKRNVGILYELLVRKVSESLVENNSETSDNALEIIEAFFAKDSVLLKEYRLFSALTKTYVESDHVIAKLLSEAKKGSNSFDQVSLEHEKSRLIKKINKTFDDANFFNAKIPEYKKFASIQTLLNAWRKPDHFGIGKIAECEERVAMLLKEKKEVEDLSDLKTKNVDPLSFKLMVEKFNNKFKTLTESQKSVIDSVIEKNKNKTRALLEIELSKAKSSIKGLKKKEASNWLLEKVDKVEKIIGTLDPSDMSEKSLQKFMTLSYMTNIIIED